MARTNFDNDVSELLHSIGLLVRRVRAAAASRELSLTESAVLARLDRHGPATIADLARAESVKPQSMGATIAAIETAELVERNPHPTDGRQMMIKLTEKGAAVRKSTRDAKRVWLANAITNLTKEEQETLFAITGILKQLGEYEPR